MWEQRITQTALGARVGIEQSSLAKKLRGKRGWSVDEILGVARELGVSVAFLFGEVDDPTAPEGGAGWAPSGSNRRPADYGGALSNLEVVTLADWRRPHAS